MPSLHQLLIPHYLVEQTVCIVMLQLSFMSTTISSPGASIPIAHPVGAA